MPCKANTALARRTGNFRNFLYVLPISDSKQAGGKHFRWKPSWGLRFCAGPGGIIVVTASNAAVSRSHSLNFLGFETFSHLITVVET